jgi:putative redox protein
MVEATCTWIDADRFAGISSSHHAVVVDAGKDKSANSPMELVLIGLCGCTASDVVSIYTEIHLTYRVRGKVSRKAVEDAVRLSEEKYCSVAAMLNKTAKISYDIEYVADEKIAGD